MRCDAMQWEEPDWSYYVRGPPGGKATSELSEDSDRLKGQFVSSAGRRLALALWSSSGKKKNLFFSGGPPLRPVAKTLPVPRLPSSSPLTNPSARNLLGSCFAPAGRPQIPSGPSLLLPAAALGPDGRRLCFLRLTPHVSPSPTTPPLSDPSSFPALSFFTPRWKPGTATGSQHSNSSTHDGTSTS